MNETESFTKMWFLREDAMCRENPKNAEFNQRIKNLCASVINFETENEFFDKAEEIATECEIRHYSTAFHYPTHKLLQNAWVGR